MTDESDQTKEIDLSVFKPDFTLYTKLHGVYADMFGMVVTAWIDVTKAQLAQLTRIASVAGGGAAPFETYQSFVRDMVSGAFSHVADKGDNAEAQPSRKIRITEK